MHPFFAGTPFLHGFSRPKKLKKGPSRISEQKMTEISNYVFFIWVILYRREKYLLIFDYSFKFSMFLMSKPRISSNETVVLYEKGESLDIVDFI